MGSHDSPVLRDELREELFGDQLAADVDVLAPLLWRFFVVGVPFWMLCWAVGLFWYVVIEPVVPFPFCMLGGR